MKPKKQRLDSRQMVLDFIGVYAEEHNRPPTVREIQKHCGFKSPGPFLISSSGWKRRN